MSWPTTTSTSTVDNAQDAPQAARLDIQKNIVDTNAIIDIFDGIDISNPPDGATLRYSGTGWDYITIDAPYGFYYADIRMTGTSSAQSGTVSVSDSTNIEVFDRLFDENDHCEGGESPTDFTLTPGTYDIVISGHARVAHNDASNNGLSPISDISISNIEHSLLNTTDSTVVATYTPAISTLQDIESVATFPDDIVLYAFNMAARTTITSNKTFDFKTTYDITWNQSTAPTTTTSTGGMQGLLLIKILEVT
jgi:hypothetical protein